MDTKRSSENISDDPVRLYFRLFHQHGNKLKLYRIARRIFCMHGAEFLFVFVNLPVAVVFAQLAFFKFKRERHRAREVFSVHRRNDQVVAARVGVRLHIGNHLRHETRIQEHKHNRRHDIVEMILKVGCTLSLRNRLRICTFTVSSEMNN